MGISVARPVVGIRRKKRSALYGKVFGARRASPRCVVAKVLRRAWSKEFLQAGKRRLAGDTAREATSQEVKMLRAEARALKSALAEQMLENRLLKKA